MTWVKTDDGAPEHMKLRGAGTAGFALWNAALAFCNRNETDGRIEVFLLPDVWRPIGERFNHKAAADRLVLACLWHKHGEPCDSKLCPANPEIAVRLDPVGGFVVHDYFEYQKSKAQLIEDRKKGADRVRRHRELALANAITPTVGNDVTDGDVKRVTDTVSNAPPIPNPNPIPIPGTTGGVVCAWGFPRLLGLREVNKRVEDALGRSIPPKWVPLVESYSPYSEREVDEAITEAKREASSNPGLIARILERYRKTKPAEPRAATGRFGGRKGTTSADIERAGREWAAEDSTDA